MCLEPYQALPTLRHCLTSIAASRRLPLSRGPAADPIYLLRRTRENLRSPVLDSDVMCNSVCVYACVCVCVCVWCGVGRCSPGVGWLAYSRINPYERRATVDSVFLARYERDSVSTGSSESIKREWSRGYACGGAKTTFPRLEEGACKPNQ